MMEVQINEVKVSYLNKAFYHYDSNTDSLIKTIKTKSVDSIIFFVNYFKQKLDKQIYTKEMFRIKSSAKELAFRSGLYSNQYVTELYSEINNQYLRNIYAGFSILLQPDYMGVHLAIKGFNKAYFCYNKILKTRMFIGRIVRRMKSICKL